MDQNQTGSVYVPQVKPPSYYEEQEQLRQAKALTLTAAAEQQRSKIAEQQKKAKQEAWLQDAVKRHSVDGKPDYDSIIAEGASMFPDWALEAGKTLAQQRAAMKQARAAELQAEKSVMDNDLEVLKRMTPSSYSVYLPKLSPELQQVMGPTFDPANTPKLIAELAGKGQTEAQRLESLRLLTNKDTRAALLTELDTATTPEAVNDVWSGWEAMYGVKDMAAMRQRIGDVSTPEGKTRLQALIGEQAKPENAPNVGSFEDYLIRSYGTNPTPKQIEAARKAYNQADDRPPQVTINTGSGSDVAETVRGMKDGTLPPLLPGRGTKEYVALSAEAHRQGFDLAAAATDWAATQKHIATLNGAQQTRLNQAIGQLPELLDTVDNLAKRWKAGGYPLLNKAQLAAAKNGLLGKDAASIANQLDAQIADVNADLATVYMGGNSPTDRGLELASKALNSNWDERVLLDMVKLARNNVRTRQNSIRNTGVQGASEGNPYIPKTTEKPAEAAGGWVFDPVTGKLVKKGG